MELEGGLISFAEEVDLEFLEAAEREIVPLPSAIQEWHDDVVVEEVMLERMRVPIQPSHVLAENSASVSHPSAFDIEEPNLSRSLLVTSNNVSSSTFALRKPKAWKACAKCKEELISKGLTADQSIALIKENRENADSKRPKANCTGGYSISNCSGFGHNYVVE